MKNLLVLISLVISIPSFGQEPISLLKSKLESDSSLTENDKKRIIREQRKKNKTNLRKGLNAEFTQIITGSATSGIGNFASINSTDATFSGAYNITTDRGVIVDFGLSGGATEGLVAILEKGKINSNVKLSGTAHILLEPYKFQNLVKRPLESDRIAHFTSYEKIINTFIKTVHPLFLALSMLATVIK